MTGHISDTWYEDFFQGINCELWEKAVSSEWTKQEADFIVHELNLKPGQLILDIPCGFGRHSVELAKLGFQVTGIDISETYITKLNNKIKSEKLLIEAIQSDILNVNLKGKFSGAICMGNSFGYFHFDKMKTFVEKVSNSLEPGGRFIINSGMIAECVLPNFQKTRSFLVDDITMDISNEYNPEESYMISNITYTKNEIKEVHSFKHYVFTLGEVSRLLKTYGLQIISTYSSPDKKEFKLGDHQIYIVSQKE